MTLDMSNNFLEIALKNTSLISNKQKTKVEGTCLEDFLDIPFNELVFNAEKDALVVEISEEMGSFMLQKPTNCLVSVQGGAQRRCDKCNSVKVNNRL